MNDEEKREIPTSYCCNVTIYSTGRFKYFCSKCNTSQMMFLVVFYEALEKEKEIEVKDKN